MRRWLQDEHFRSLLKNSGYLAASKAVAGVTGFITLALAGRSLGVATFGMLILVASYAQAVGGIAKFNSWQVVVLYGSPAIERGDLHTFRRATDFAVGLDLVSGLVALAGSLLILPFVSQTFGIPPQYVAYALIYCLLVPTMGSAFTGVLRAFDRFDLLSWQGTIQPNLRAVLAAIGWWQGYGFDYFFAIWFVTDVIAALATFLFARRELKRHSVGRIRPSLSARDLPNGWRYAINVNVNSTVSTSWGPVGRLLIGGLLDAASAGLYRVASSVADAVQKPTILLTKALYPQLLRLDPRTKAPWRLLFRVIVSSGLLSLLLILVAALFGEWVLAAAFGAEFIGAYKVLLILLGASLFSLVSFPMPPMLESLGRIGIPTAANIAGAIAYLAAFYPLTTSFGLVGAGLAFLIGKLVVTIYMTAVLASERERLHRDNP
ncbi:oligosaccharide flippase family protein [Sphingomonas sinipercae]|uniref:Oligosaccharide flippase family protein n=1 Tax=Sphingomonas sinipercae TaxID=2714944 RepID=A0A6G7ZNV4_9SPHN|nr:polysaccharide biosynthesis C-terminal domain-containing protein [Sphingomonas sinipercae]QIL02677.1 oligosaccharide flippase family protein [Sphingomonas sinipercae]